MWKYYAILSALFAALTAIFAKIGVRDINSNLATAIRTTIILLLTWGIVIATGTISQIRGIGRHTWGFLILSGIATGLSWLFYFKALQTGDVSRVAPIDKLSEYIEDNACGLQLDPGGVIWTDGLYRYDGLSVRPVAR